MEKQMLAGKVAVITGASYGMGQTMAELFSEEGASVVLTARGHDKLDTVVKEIRAKGGKAIGIVADVCSLEDTQKVFAETIKEFGDLDILINNAGIGEQNFPGPECEAIDQAYACLYLASKMGRAVRGRL